MTLMTKLKLGALAVVAIYLFGQALPALILLLK